MIKHCLSAALLLFFINSGLAQETSKRRNRLTDSVTEVYTILKSDGVTRQGLYQALFQKKVIIASGDYAGDKRTGLWQFYDPKGKVVQTYNYTTGKRYYEAPEDTTSKLKYFIDQRLDSAAKVTKPIKTGGIYYGYLPYLRLFTLPNYLSGLDKSFLTALVELLVSPGGRLADYKVHIISGTGEIIKVVNMNINLPDPADVVFTPATLNGEPVSCRIMIKCYVSNDGHLNYDY